MDPRDPCYMKSNIIQHIFQRAKIIHMVLSHFREYVTRASKEEVAIMTLGS